MTSLPLHSTPVPWFKTWDFNGLVVTLIVILMEISSPTLIIKSSLRWWLTTAHHHHHLHHTHKISSYSNRPQSATRRMRRENWGRWVRSSCSGTSPLVFKSKGFNSKLETQVEGASARFFPPSTSRTWIDLILVRESRVRWTWTCSLWNSSLILIVGFQLDVWAPRRTIFMVFTKTTYIMVLMIICNNPGHLIARVKWVTLFFFLSSLR